MKNLLKSIIIAAACLSVNAASANQPDISSLIFVEQQPGKWMLQLNASMTAFQYELKNAYGEDFYKSPEEFNQLLSNYLKEQIAIKVNGENVTLGNGIVQLGQATTVAFEISGVPEEVEKVFVLNKGFENIRHSQAVFSIIKSGLDRYRFVLSEENDYQLNLSLKGNQVLLAKASWFDNRIILAVIIILAGMLVFLMFKSIFIIKDITPKILTNA